MTAVIRPTGLGSSEVRDLAEPVMNGPLHVSAKIRKSKQPQPSKPGFVIVKVSPLVEEFKTAGPTLDLGSIFEAALVHDVFGESELTLKLSATEAAVHDADDLAMCDFSNQLRSSVVFEQGRYQLAHVILSQIHEQPLRDEEESAAGFVGKFIKPIEIEDRRRDEVEALGFVKEASAQGDHRGQVNVVPAHLTIVDTVPAIV